MPVYHRDPSLSLLFIFYVNDLNYFVCNSSLRVYGDDTIEYASDPSLSPSGLAADPSVLSS